VRKAAASSRQLNVKEREDGGDEGVLSDGMMMLTVLGARGDGDGGKDDAIVESGDRKLAIVGDGVILIYIIYLT